MSFIARGWPLPLVAATLFVSACATTGPPRVTPAEIQGYLADKPAILQPYYLPVLMEGKRNLVLNHMRAGLVAMEAGEWAWAEHSFDQALLSIEAIYANNDQAAKARSLWYEESSKDFKGEPYERAMAYFYRGLLYLRGGDYENARACFKSGILQDAFAEEEQDRCDFAVLIFLVGWCSQQLGDQDLADKAYQELKMLRPDFSPPNREDNTLVLIETGRSPRKVADGVGHGELKYRRGKKFAENRATVLVDGRRLGLYPMEDVFRQASTRGGRPIDKLLEGKVVFMQNSMEVGSILTEAGSFATLASTMAGSSAGTLSYIGGALSVAGGVTTIVGMNVKPHADVRFWDNLPDGIHLLTVRLEQRSPISVIYADREGNRLPELPRQELLPLLDKAGRALYWGRSRSAFVALGESKK